MAFILAILIHSTVDGLAIGVFDEAGEMIVLTTSVIIHKIPLAFTVGTTLISQGQSLCSCTTLTSLILFIISTPIGVGIGMGVSQAGQSNIGLIVV